MKVVRIALVATALSGFQGALHAQAPPDRPFIVSSTFWGGSAFENYATVAVDATGNVYVAGSTTSADFPKTISHLPSAPGSMDIFVTKFDAAGNLIFSTAFGGSASERVTSVAVDAGGNIIIGGDTFSADLPMVNPIQGAFHQSICGEFGGTCGDGFVMKIDATAQHILFSSYLGTTGLDNVRDLAVDGGGNIYVIGSTDRGTFDGASPVRAYSGSRDAFIAKIPPSGNAFSYFTFLGSGSDDTGNGVAVDQSGNAYLTGIAASSSFPVLNPIQSAPENFSTSAFVTKLDAAGFLVYSTFLGGNAADAGVDIAVDAQGSAHVIGVTASSNFPTANAQQMFIRGFNDAFLAKLSPSGSSLIYSTFLGGTDREDVFIDFDPAFDLALDGAGNAYLTGSTQSPDFQLAYQLQGFGGGLCSIFLFRTENCPDAFVAKFDGQGRLVFATPIGGNDDDRGRGIAVTPDGMVHVVGHVRSTNFPLVSPVQPAYGGTTDAFITKIATAPPACQLPAPKPIGPSGSTATQQPMFTWQSVDGAEAYYVISSRLADSLLVGNAGGELAGITTATSLASSAVFPPGDYGWVVVPWNSTCGSGRPSAGTAFTVLTTCPTPTANLLTPNHGASVGNPASLLWFVDSPRAVTMSVVIVLSQDGRLIGQWATQENFFTIPVTLSVGSYSWYVMTWNSTCGAVLAGPGVFRSTGMTLPSP